MKLKLIPYELVEKANSGDEDSLAELGRAYSECEFVISIDPVRDEAKMSKSPPDILGILDHTKDFQTIGIVGTKRRTNMTFGEAIEALKAGKKVARSGWNGKGMYLWLLPATEVKKEWCRDPRLIEAMGDRDSLPCLGSIRMFTANREVLTGWLASQTDILAEDWMIVE